MPKDPLPRAYRSCCVTYSTSLRVPHQVRPLSPFSYPSCTKPEPGDQRWISHYSRGSDETSISSAKHKPRLSDPSIGLLITELSTTTPQMLKDGLRMEGHMIDEGDRKAIRRLAYGTVAFGAIFTGMLIVFGKGRSDDDR